MNRYTQSGLQRSRLNQSGASQKHRPLGQSPVLGKPCHQQTLHKRLYLNRLLQGASSKILGLTLVESLVALLILMTLISVVLQLMASTAWLASQAERNNQAMHWIQADVEDVKQRARDYEKNAFPYSAHCAGLAAQFIAAELGATTTQGPKPIGGGNLVLRRTASNTTSPDPVKIVQLNYVVVPREGGPAIAEFDIEVVPYAAFKCP
jgi:type II secretory pathway pseudopilin PulG